MAFLLASLVAYTAVVLVALRLRGRFYATFAGVVLGIHTLVTAALWPHTGIARPLFAYLQAVTFVHFFSLIWARPRSVLWRYAIALPAMYFVGAVLLALPWALAFAFGFHPWVPWLPFAIALVGVFESVWARESVVDLTLDGVRADGDKPRRWRRRAPSDRDGEPLRIVQITDPHLGPWMSARRLRSICARAVAREPDLILLTGDFLTMDTNRAPDALAEALSPLTAMGGRVFACRGNHDLEAPETVAKALARAGVRLLIDEEVVVQTAAGPVQLLGIDHRWRGRREHVRAVCEQHPPASGAWRVVLLHDPGAFKYLPDGEGAGDLVLSGHTHGGQVGLVSLGLPWTMLRLFVDMPDHGLWARGVDRLYVHRGTGHYGFPLRVGVPVERSLLRVWR